MFRDLVGMLHLVCLVLLASLLSLTSLHHSKQTFLLLSRQEESTLMDLGLALCLGISGDLQCTLGSSLLRSHLSPGSARQHLDPRPGARVTLQEPGMCCPHTCQIYQWLLLLQCPLLLPPLPDGLCGSCTQRTSEEWKT